MFRDTTQGRINDHTSLLLHVDGGCEPKNPGGVATAGWVLYDPKQPTKPLVEEGRVVQDGGKLATNNTGEYCALGFALKWLNEQGWKGELTVKADSKLLVEQVNERWKCKAEHLATFRKKIWKLMEDMGLQRVSEDSPLPDDGRHAFRLVWVPREQNQAPDGLCHEAYKEYTEKK